MSKHVSRRNFLERSGAAALYLSSRPFSFQPQVVKGSEKLKSHISAEALTADLTELVSELMSKFKVPGLSIAVIKDAKLLWQQAFGVQNPTTKEPVTSDTLFEAASLSKPAFAYAVLQMCDKGVLKLDAPLTEYLPQPFIPNEPRLELVTARMALSHTSGFPHGRSENEPLALRFDPGKQFFYSATGFDYLQRVVQHISGQPLADLMRVNVLEPFGMSRSSFGLPERYEKQRAQGYDSKGKPGQTFNERHRLSTAEWRAKVAKMFPELSYPSAAAGMYSTATDFAKYIIEIIEPSNKGKVDLSDHMSKEMLRPQVKVSGDCSWGLGWGIQNARVGATFWHWGNWSGLFQHFAVGLKKERTGVVVMTNSGNGLKLCRELVPKAIGLDIEPLRGFLS